MKVARAIAACTFAATVTAMTITDVPVARPPSGPTVLAGDFHIHGMPGDGALPVWEIQREAARRGLDVIAITNHNSNLSIRLARGLGLLASYPIVIPGEEVTTGSFHLAAIGITTLVDHRLSAVAAIEAIHMQGGVAIGAHASVTDPDANRALDGTEAAHRQILIGPRWAGHIRRAYDDAQAVHPGIAPIGSSDFHVGEPLGLCRTYLVVEEVSAAGVLDAIRRGRTVAAGPGDRLVGAEEHIKTVGPYLRRPQLPGFGYGVSTLLSVLALLALGTIVALDARSSAGDSLFEADRARRQPDQVRGDHKPDAGLATRDRGKA